MLRKDRKVRGEDGGDAAARRGNSTKLMDAASSPGVVISIEDDDGEGVDLYRIPPALDPSGSGSDGSAGSGSSTPAVDAATTDNNNNNKGEEEEEDQKKPGFTTEYEGFTIYDKVLCLVVQRTATTQRRRNATETEAETEGGGVSEKEKGAERAGEKAAERAGEEASERGGGLIEGWIAMSQAVRQGGDVDIDVDE